jgi:PhoH-like ATPase
MKRTYVPDTSVLIHDPESLLAFEENDVAVPLEVIKELDRIKTESSERGQAARSVQRKLLAVIAQGQSGRLPGGGTLRILIPPEEETTRRGNIGRILGNMETSDHIIIATTAWLLKTSPHPVVLVSKDMGLLLKARAASIPCEDYRHDKSEAEKPESPTIDIAPEELHQFLTAKSLELDQIRTGELEMNSYGLFKTKDKKTPWRHLGSGRFKPIIKGPLNIQGGTSINPKNMGQACMMDALLDHSIDMVTVAGPAGTGKTLVTMAAALVMIQAGRYNGLCITKPNEPVGRENGFLPGTIEEKMKPWLQPYADAINLLHRRTPAQNKRQSQRKTGAKDQSPCRRPFDTLTETGILTITALEHIRGRSIPQEVFVVDETQNIQPKVTLTITSRMAEGTKLVYLGDPDQIDNPYLDKYSNGLAHVRGRMRNLANIAHITLHKCERSLLAEQAAKRL